MKRYLTMLALIGLLLSGCAEEQPAVIATMETTMAVAEVPETLPAETTEPADPYGGMTEEEKAVAQCRAVLDAVQRGDSYYITLTKWHEGTYDKTMQTEYYRHANDRARISRSSSDDMDGQFLQWLGTSVSVRKDGVTYHGYSEDNRNITWEGQSSETLEFDPWMYTFDWDAQEVELTEIRKTAEGRCISFKVHAVYDITYGFAEDYTITFYFDEEGNFVERELIATAEEMIPTYREENGEWVRLAPDDPNVEKTGRVITRIDHVTVESLDPQEIGAAIDALYLDALAQQKG